MQLTFFVYNLGFTAPIIWILAKCLNIDQKLLNEIEVLIVELTETDSFLHKKKEDLLLLLWICQPDYCILFCKIFIKYSIFSGFYIGGTIS